MNVFHLSSAPNPCAAKDGKEPCSHLCLINYNQTFSCACPHLMKLGPDKRTCYGEWAWTHHVYINAENTLISLSIADNFPPFFLSRVDIEYHTAPPLSCVFMCVTEKWLNNPEVFSLWGAVRALERIEVFAWKVRAVLFIQCVSLVFRAALSIIFRGNGMESPILSDAGISCNLPHPLHSLLWPIQPDTVITLTSPSLFSLFPVYRLSYTQLNDSWLLKPMQL